jgi:pimeloyl-ACP methyl ester carboxylesterase
MTMNMAALGGANIHYAQVGPERRRLAPVQDVVLVHGLATSMAFWYFGVAKFLANFARVTVVDLRGHGKSSMPAEGYTADEMAEDLHGVLTYLQMERAHLIGHSYGGLIAAAFAAKHPAFVKSLVLADVRLPSVQPQLKMSGWPLAEAYAARLKEAGIAIDPESPDFGVELLTEVARLRLKGEGDSEKLEKVFGGARRIMGPRVAAKWLKLLDTTTARRDFAYGSALKPDDLRVVNAPVYGIYGRNSMTIESGKALAEALPRCRFEAIPKAGHFFPASRPRDFAVRSLKFLAANAGVARRGAVRGEGRPQLPQLLN